jgi:hypothetical protein
MAGEDSAKHTLSLLRSLATANAKRIDAMRPLPELDAEFDKNFQPTAEHLARADARIEERRRRIADAAIIVQAIQEEIQAGFEASANLASDLRIDYASLAQLVGGFNQTVVDVRMLEAATIFSERLNRAISRNGDSTRAAASPKEGLTAKEVASRWQVTGGNVTRWCNDNQNLGVTKDARGWRIPSTAVASFPWPVRATTKKRPAAVLHHCESCSHNFDGVAPRPACPKCHSVLTSRVARRAGAH